MHLLHRGETKNIGLVLKLFYDLLLVIVEERIICNCYHHLAVEEILKEGSRPSMGYYQICRMIVLADIRRNSKVLARFGDILTSKSTFNYLLPI